MVNPHHYLLDHLVHRRPLTLPQVLHLRQGPPTILRLGVNKVNRATVLTINKPPDTYNWLTTITARLNKLDEK
jgi:hypothetical protein